MNFQNGEFKFLTDFKIMAFENREFKTDFKIMVFENREFKILADLKILVYFKSLGLQNPELKDLVGFKIKAF